MRKGSEKKQAVGILPLVDLPSWYLTPTRVEVARTTSNDRRILFVRPQRSHDLYDRMILLARPHVIAGSCSYDPNARTTHMIPRNQVLSKIVGHKFIGHKSVGHQICWSPDLSKSVGHQICRPQFCWPQISWSPTITAVSSYDSDSFYKERLALRLS
jgi:hypothetical protein